MYPKNLQTAFVGRLRHCTEVDVRGQVVQARQPEDVAVGEVTVVAHDRAHQPLRVVVLPSWKAVVDGDERPARQPLCRSAHPRDCVEADFRAVAVGKLAHLAFDLGHCGDQVGRRRALDEPETAVEGSDAPLRDHSPALDEEPHRHHIEHFVGQHDTREVDRRRRQPIDRLARKQRLLTLPQFGRDFDDRVALARCAALSQCPQ